MNPTATATDATATDAATGALALDRPFSGRRLTNALRAGRTRTVAPGKLYWPPPLHAKAARPVNGAFGRRDAPVAPPPTAERRALARAARRALSGR